MNNSMQCCCQSPPDTERRPAVCLQRPRVLTPALSAAAERHGFSLLALDPAADPQQWAAQGVDVIVHKVPEDHGECPEECRASCSSKLLLAGNY